jgi:hypothetical protein
MNDTHVGGDCERAGMRGRESSRQTHGTLAPPFDTKGLVAASAHRGVAAPHARRVRGALGVQAQELCVRVRVCVCVCVCVCVRAAKGGKIGAERQQGAEDSQHRALLAGVRVCVCVCVSARACMPAHSKDSAQHIMDRQVAFPPPLSTHSGTHQRCRATPAWQRTCCGGWRRRSPPP